MVVIVIAITVAKVNLNMEELFIELFILRLLFFQGDKLSK
jgi:hypothetical protein